jgi:hypothetical protein
MHREELHHADTAFAGPLLIPMGAVHLPAPRWSQRISPTGPSSQTGWTMGPQGPPLTPFLISATHEPRILQASSGSYTSIRGSDRIPETAQILWMVASGHGAPRICQTPFHSCMCTMMKRGSTEPSLGARDSQLLS